MSGAAYVRRRGDNRHTVDMLPKPQGSPPNPNWIEGWNAACKWLAECWEEIAADKTCTKAQAEDFTYAAQVTRVWRVRNGLAAM